ncbi:probable 5-hydroxyisourate hydrolase R09H10.3 isoform X2 [Folsomia candida]|uniref:probable 5-hydroxyisourate hydrolase R09H10.3 isoform X2 n=1 Tax=Folsomia candida TaxID=158441 RepID=UPI000B8F17BE|nr:probable 5-hydroxyisourate hydrolase R09H10.3 isoform X2 [Folsomia candida]
MLYMCFGLLILIIPFCTGKQVELAKTNFGIRDLNTGVGLHNITAELYREASKNNEIMEWDLIGTAKTTITGRVDFNITTDEFGSGSYRLVYYTRPYYQAQNFSSFYPYVEIMFDKPEANNTVYTVPMLVSPFGYNGYKGSAKTG